MKMVLELEPLNLEPEQYSLVVLEHSHLDLGLVHSRLVEEPSNLVEMGHSHLGLVLASLKHISIAILSSIEKSRDEKS